MAIKRFLTPKVFPLGQDIFLPIDPSTQFGYMGTGEGGVERVSSQGRVQVQVYDWRGWGLDEEAILIKVLAEAAAANPLKVAKMSNLNTAFWAKIGGMQVAISHPDNVGAFQAPVEVLVSPEVPKDRLIVLKGSHMTGYYVKQEARRNILAHNKHGLLSIEFYQP